GDGRAASQVPWRACRPPFADHRLLEGEGPLAQEAWRRLRGARRGEGTGAGARGVAQPGAARASWACAAPGRRPRDFLRWQQAPQRARTRAAEACYADAA